MEVKKLLYTMESDELTFNDFKLFGQKIALDQEKGRSGHR